MSKEYCCYNNIPTLIAHRQQTRVVDIIGKGIIMIEDNLPFKQFDSQLATYHYINFAGIKDDMLNLYVLIREKTPLAEKSPEFANIRNLIVANILDYISSQDNKIKKLKMTYIVPSEFTSYFVSAASSSIESAIEHEWEAHIYDKFIQVIPNRKDIPKHEICSEKEINQYCDFQRINKEQLQRIQVDDSMCVWIGAKVGDVVKIYRISENCGESIAYRWVVDNREKVKPTKRKKKTLVTLD